VTRHDVSTYATAFGWGWGCSCGRHGNGTSARSPEAARAYASRHIVKARRAETAASSAAHVAAVRAARRRS
jgi:hypothetical protein